MNLSKRSKISLCQFLGILHRDEQKNLMVKYEFDFNEDEGEIFHAKKITGYNREDALRNVLIDPIRNAILIATNNKIASLLDELLRTASIIRNKISPKSNYDVRWGDLIGCLELDGYIDAQDENGGKQFVPIDPTIAGQEPLEDDLTRELKAANLPDTAGILSCLENSTTAFRCTQAPDFNAALTNARIALESIVKGIAKIEANFELSPDESKRWGKSLAQLKENNIISKPQEELIAKVYTFISPGCHRPQAMTEREYVRLARHLAVSMAFFLLKARKEEHNGL